jgi:hypothetical protein
MSSIQPALETMEIIKMSGLLSRKGDSTSTFASTTLKNMATSKDLTFGKKQLEKNCGRIYP